MGPAGQVPVEKCLESRVVHWNAQMKQFVYEDVLEAFAGLAREVGIEADVLAPG